MDQHAGRERVSDLPDRGAIVPESVSRIIIHVDQGFDLPYVESAQNALTGFAADAWTSLANAFPEFVIAINPVLQTQSADQVRGLMVLAQARSGEEAPDLLRTMAVDVTGDVDLSPVLPAVQALPF